MARLMFVSVISRFSKPVYATNRYFSERSALEEEINHQLPPLHQKTPEDMFYGISTEAFAPKVTNVLMKPVNKDDIEIKPDGLIYLPEIMYRRILNESFGPGGWALMPRGDTLHYQNDQEGAQLITREYALYCHGRYVSQAVGEHTFYNKGNLQYGKACESAKSNALMRCCKDLGVASELWDPKFISKWKEVNAISVWCENVRTREKKRLWKRTDRHSDSFAYPWKEVQQK